MELFNLDIERRKGAKYIKRRMVSAGLIVDRHCPGKEQ